MKKEYLKTICIGMLLTGAMTACEKDDNNGSSPDFPTTSSGAFVLCQGNYYNSIPGSLTAIDYETGQSEVGIFEKVNSRSLGDTPQCIVSYGSKLYIGTYASNTIEIVDRSTFRSIKQLKPGDNGIEGTQPRSMVTHEGKVYISMYDGYVACLDTLTQTITKSVKVGPNPDKIALFQGKIYVPNTDGMSYPVLGDTYSVINESTFTLEGTYKCPLNPDSFYAAGDHLFILCRGNYAAMDSPEYVPSAIYEITGNGESSYIANATIMTASEKTIYMVDDPFYGSGEASYKKYDIKSGKTTDWTIQQPEYAQGLAIDPVTNDILISSLVRDGQYPSFNAPGYVVRYDGENDRWLQKFNVGSGPTAIAFNTK